MSDFVLDTTRKYRTKVNYNFIQDEEMMKVTEYKTGCIKKFISMMQTWL